MVIGLLIWVVLAISRGVIANIFDVSSFGSHIWFLLPDALFFVYTLYYVFIQEKRKVTLPVVGFLLAFLGSLVWDYQSGFYFLKFFFPAVFFLALHVDKLRALRITEVLKMLLYFLPPTLLVSAIQNRRKAEVTEKVRVPFLKAGIVGIVIGLIMMLILAGLDPSFAKFLRINEWFNMFKSSVGSLIYYGFTFFYFFWLPVRAKWEPKEGLHTLPKLLQVAVMLIFAVIIGYTVYDAYILLRAFKLMALTFESMGRNTQMNFLELVILGGAWLFSVIFVLSHIKSQPKEHTTSYKVITAFLLASLLWLLPPVYNILRVLLSVYIPTYGLTAMRLFGLYTTITFLVALVIAVIYNFVSPKRMFGDSVVWFGVVLVLLSFALPNNVMLYQWHFDAYKNGKEVDFSYVRHLKLEKWGSLFFSQLDTTKRAQDNIWGLLLAQRARDEKRQDIYRAAIAEEVKKDLDRVEELIVAQEFSTLVTEYGKKDWWVYRDGKIDGLTLRVRRQPYNAKNIRIQTDRSVFGNSVDQSMVNYSVMYSYKGSVATISTYLMVENDPAKKHFVSLGNELLPFFAYNRSAILQPCSYGYGASEGISGRLSDRMLVERYLLVKPSCSYDQGYYN